MDWPAATVAIAAILTAGYCYGFRLWLDHDDQPSERTEAIGFQLAQYKDEDA